ncbi:hypothetical protein KBC55_01920 [Patescibacteria group bacterium]|nr:hypothetical protein [Patescibacteria group bacterium]
MSFESLALAEALVKSRIVGTRIGSEKPQWQHSCDVRDKLAMYKYPQEVVLAGLLHDAIEDAGATALELQEIGCSDRTLELIDLATHDSAIEDKDHRWAKMMVRLADAKDADAWAIKLADLLSNMTDCGTMPTDRALLMIEVKAGLMLALAAPLMADTPLYKELKRLRDHALYAAPRP